MLRRILCGPLAGLMAFWAVPLTTASASASASAVATVAPAPPPDEDVVVIDDDEMEGNQPEPGAEEGGETPPPEDGGDLDIFGDDQADKTATTGATPTAAQEKDSEENQIKTDSQLIDVIARQRFLKKGRFELQPQIGITVNDPYVRHYTLGLDMNYWIRNRMAIGLFGTGFLGAKTPRYDNIRFQEGLLLTANRVLWQAAVNFTYNPFYGKIAIFNRWLLHWEVGTSIGGGVMQTRVIPRYESLHDPFTNLTGGGVIGFHGRTYVPRLDWLAVDAGVRLWIYPDKYEPNQRGPATDPNNPDAVDLAELDDPGNAKDAADWRVAFNVSVFLGVSFFFPTSFKYTTPR
jgi:outer membrane beta-barrel protein